MKRSVSRLSQDEPTLALPRLGFRWSAASAWPASISPANSSTSSRSLIPIRLQILTRQTAPSSSGQYGLSNALHVGSVM